MENRVTVIKEFPGLPVGSELVLDEALNLYEYMATDTEVGEDYEYTKFSSISLSPEYIEENAEFFAPVKEKGKIIARGVYYDNNGEYKTRSIEEIIEKMNSIVDKFENSPEMDDEEYDVLLHSLWTLEWVAGITGDVEFKSHDGDCKNCESNG